MPTCEMLRCQMQQGVPSIKPSVDTPTHDQGPPTDDMETGEQYRRRVFVIREDGSKEGLSVAFATQGGHNIISYKICKDLDLAIEHHITELGTPAYGQQTTTPITHIARNVRWQFQGSEATYTTDFLVNDYIKFDALVGQATIEMYDLLAPKNMPYYDGPLRA